MGNDTPLNRRDTFNFNMNREINHRPSFRGIVNRESVNLAFEDFDGDDFEQVAHAHSAETRPKNWRGKSWAQIAGISLAIVYLESCIIYVSSPSKKYDQSKLNKISTDGLCALNVN